MSASNAELDAKIIEQRTILDRGIVYQDVKPAQAIAHGLDHRDHRGLVGLIQSNRDGFGPSGREFCGGRLSPGLVDICDGDRSARARQIARNLLAHAFRRSGDDRDFSGQIENRPHINKFHHGEFSKSRCDLKMPATNRQLASIV